MHDRVAADLATRKALGLRKYGSLLQAFNGRNALLDLYEELLDAVVYLRQCLDEGEAYGAHAQHQGPAAASREMSPCSGRADHLPAPGQDPRTGDLVTERSGG